MYSILNLFNAPSALEAKGQDILKPKGSAQEICLLAETIITAIGAVCFVYGCIHGLPIVAVAGAGVMAGFDLDLLATVIIRELKKRPSVDELIEEFKGLEAEYDHAASCLKVAQENLSDDDVDDNLTPQELEEKITKPREEEVEKCQKNVNTSLAKLKEKEQKKVELQQRLIEEKIAYLKTVKENLCLRKEAKKGKQRLEPKIALLTQEAAQLESQIQKRQQEIPEFIEQSNSQPVNEQIRKLRIEELTLALEMAVNMINTGTLKEEQLQLVQEKKEKFSSELERLDLS